MDTEEKFLQPGANVVNIELDEDTYVEDFLMKLDLQEYKDIFIQNGYDREAAIMKIELEDLVDLNIKKGHRQIIMDELKDLKNELNRINSNPLQRIPNTRIVLKLIVIGPGNVGKTALLHRFYENRFVENTRVTETLDVVKYRKMFWDKSIMVHIWDTAGQEKYFDKIPKQYFHDSLGVLGICSADEENSIQHLTHKWLTTTRDYNKKSKIVILYNKIDLGIKNDHIEELNQLKKDNGYKIFYTSAKTGKNVNKAFDELICQILHSPELLMRATQIENSQLNHQLQSNNNNNNRNSNNKKKSCC